MTAAEESSVAIAMGGPKSVLKPGLMQYALVGIVCVSWMTVSSALILVNKAIMVDLGFSYPMAVSGLGMAFSGFASYFCCKVLRLFEAKASFTTSFYITHVLPVGFFNALTLLAGNLVYMYLSVAFIQMLKAFTPVICMLALFVARLEDPTHRLILSVLLMSIGTSMAAYGELNLSVVGVVIMMVSETAEAIRLVMTQILLQGYKFHPLEGVMWLSPACCMWLLLGIAVYELPIMLKKNALAIVHSHLPVFLFAMCLGFGVNSLAYAVIKLASSLTLKVLGVVKNTMLVFIGIIFLREAVSGTQGAGYAVSIIGFSWYQQIKMAAAASPPASGK